MMTMPASTARRTATPILPGVSLAILLAPLPLWIGGCGTTAGTTDSSTTVEDDDDTAQTTAVSMSTSGTTGSESTGSGTTDGSSGSTDGSGSESEGSSSSSGGGDALWTWDLPEGFPEPRVPEDNPMSAEKVELGRHLFYDTRLSANETQSCATCHEQALAFTDAKVLPLGSTGQTVPRNSMSLANVAYSASHTWANPVLEHLSDQAAVPLFGEDPVELGAILAEAEILDRLRAADPYPALFAAAYPEAHEPVDWINIRRAIASFERVLISGDSPYDRFLNGDDSAISESARRGAALFGSEALECHHCHGGFNLSNSVVHAGTVFDTKPFFNTGLYNIGGDGTYPVGGWGLFEFTTDHGDMGKFKPPTIRNIALTGPYMHDGSIETLDEVLDHYAAGGRTITDGENAGDGSLNPNKSSFVNGFELNAQERADMLAFFETLTDETFINDPSIADPWQ